MRFWAITDKGAVRKENQDTFSTLFDEEKKRALLVVCDGMGGAKAGNIASEMTAQRFTEEIEKNFDDNHTADTLERLMQEAVTKANRAVFEQSVLNYEYEGMGTTLVAALVKENACIVINIGDSRAYHIAPQGIRRVTRDHSVIEELIERGDVTREEARHHPQKNLITRAVGTTFDIEGDLFEVDLNEGDHLLLCSDGLTNMLTEEEIAREVLHNDDPETACRKMLELALERGATDNLTMILFEK